MVLSRFVVVSVSSLLTMLMLNAFSTAGANAADRPSTVKLQQTGGKWQLLVDQKPFFVRGAGGGGSKAELAKIGGNSFRTWGIGDDTAKELDEAQRLGLKVALGHWLGHTEHGFNYDDQKAVSQQFDDVKKGIEQYKNHPALLVWSLGNEMEVNNPSPNTWKAIQALAKLAHELDPHHPTMTVVAELGSDNQNVRLIHEQCPDIDIIGINSYGGGPSLAERYRKAGGKKPFLITEYGPPGTWEIPRTEFGAAPELTSTQKADKYRETYEKSVLGAPDLCLGSYAFTWGTKIEATSTWFGMHLPDGRKLAAVDVMQQLWTGKPSDSPCPRIEKLALDGKNQVNPGDTVTATVATVANKGKLSIEWALYREQANYDVQGPGAAPPAAFPKAIRENGQPKVTLQMPSDSGIYRLYCFVRDQQQGAATGSVPIRVLGNTTGTAVPAATLPLVIVGDQARSPYAPSGWMGDTGAIALDPECKDQPRQGKTCLRVDYKKADGWGGVVWQHPANDWGDKAGGFDLSQAQKLTFWARGQAGGEKVKFSFGLIGSDKKYADSAKAEVEVTLTKEWKQHTIDVKHLDLSCIKTGFCWVVAGQGKSLTFYLSDVRWE